MFDIFLFYVLSGRIDASEIQQSLAELGMDVNREDALKILQRFDLHFCQLSRVPIYRHVPIPSALIYLGSAFKSQDVFST